MTSMLFKFAPLARHGRTHSRQLIRLMTAGALQACLLVLAPGPRERLSAFEIGGCTAVAGLNVEHCGQPVHEEITEAAIRSALPNADQNFVNDVKHGVQNSDLTHHFESEFHFDNGTAANGAFEAGFSNVVRLLQSAKAEASVCDESGVCQRNPHFLHPQHGTFTGIADDIVATLGSIAMDLSCTADRACPTTSLAATAAAIKAEVAPTRADASPDPDRTYSKVIGDVKYNLAQILGKPCDATGHCFNNLEEMLKDRPTLEERAQHLRAMQQELNAYYAWQHLGHAFHAVQDFFAHSNYVELAAGKNGPPCAPAVLKADLCDSEISGLAPGALALPKAASPGPDVASFLDAFSAAGVRRSLGPRYDRLESGYYDTPQPFLCTPKAPLHYCHYSTSTAIGLNKDRPFANGDANPSHKNHDYARSAAVRMSAQLWAAFLHDLPPGEVHAATPVVRAAQLTLQVATGTYNTATRKATVTVTARDASTGELKSGTVVILGTNQLQQSSGQTGRPIAFGPCKEFDTELKRYVGSGSCTVRVSVSGYPVATTAVDWP